MLKALTFDLDDTLWDNKGVMARTESGHYHWLLDNLNAWRARRQEAPLALELDTGLAAYADLRQQLADKVPKRRGDFTWLRLRALEAQLEGLGLERSSALMWAAAAMNEFHRLRLDVTPFAEVEPLLDSLGKRYRLAAITNGNIRLSRQPLAHHFPVAIAAGELLMPKPDPGAFLTALQRLAVAPEHAMHIGDSWEEDILPAAKLGMRAVWVSPDAPEHLPEGVEHVHHVRELERLLGSD